MSSLKPFCVPNRTRALTKDPKDHWSESSQQELRLFNFFEANHFLHLSFSSAASESFRGEPFVSGMRWYAPL